MVNEIELYSIQLQIGPIIVFKNLEVHCNFRVS
jgi:hypothetical protein